MLTLFFLIVAENIEKGSNVLKITARDADAGSNGDIRYAIASDAGDVLNIFDIDAYSGWISTLVPLDREQFSDYKFQVIATDNGSPKHVSKCYVHIKLKKYNLNPPVFKNKLYEAKISEDALPGTVLTQVSVVDRDLDLNTPYEFYIIAGDPLTQFQIRQTGDLFIVKSLDREATASYNLQLIVTDGKYSSKANVSVQVVDANDNPPYCLKYRYRKSISEGVPQGTQILTVLASDADEPENAKLRFYLTGTGAEEFSLDKDTGVLKTARQLDRETYSKIQLVAHVQDRDHPGWECSCEIEIIVLDLNDNAPEFSLSTYSVAMPEDAEVGMLVTKVHATDKDVGVNRKLKYSFIDSHNNHFNIIPESGIVTLAKPLDREAKSLYNLTVKATDLGRPPLSSSAILIVNVQGKSVKLKIAKTLREL